MRTAASTAVLTIALAATSACHREAGGPSPAEPESWPVTAWGENFEIFAETEPLVAGQTAPSHVHVTVLKDFSPLREGRVSALLRDTTGGLETFTQERPKRDGIFGIDIRPAKPGNFDLVFRVEAGGVAEDVPAGTVRVGTAGAPGGPAAGHGHAGDGHAHDAHAEHTHDAPAGAVTVPFLKEQQWKTPFATAWVREGALRESVRGAARVRPAAGGEAVLTASADATLLAEPWPHGGLDVARGDVLFRLLPRASSRSLRELEADAASLDAERAVARKRVERLGELLKVEAVSPAELERAHATLLALESKLAAAHQELEAATGAGGPSENALAVRAPWAGRLAEVHVSPGQAVPAHTALARLVRVRPLWLEVALRPDDARRVREPLRGLHLQASGESEPVVIPQAEVRLVARSPEIDVRTASVTVIVAIDRSASELPIGSAVEAEVLLDGERRGPAVPASAVVDDSGTVVVYVQTEGESFERREVQIVARQGARCVVSGLRPDERVVTRGGDAIRRASLVSSGAPEGHVH